jgi:hypothetical protein
MVFVSSWKQIVDSVIALFRVDFSGRGEHAEHQVFSSIHFDGSRHLVKMLKGDVLSACLCVPAVKLQEKQFNVAVYITSQGGLAI